MAKDTFSRMMEQMEERLRDVEEMFREFERSFDDQFSKQFGTQIRERFTGFPTDVRETDGQIIVDAELPGVEKDQIDINVTEDAVDINAQDELEVNEEGKDYIRQERRSRNYQRSIRLPAEVEPGSAEASYENGVLTITMDKTSEGRGTNVPIE